ncbi:MAG: hypothetical protein KGL04_05525 [Elusimicrobia bacterium]|nr:hypothetical protein [Elusimicrobiota bacterium]
MENKGVKAGFMLALAMMAGSVFAHRARAGAFDFGARGDAGFASSLAGVQAAALRWRRPVARPLPLFGWKKHPPKLQSAPITLLRRTGAAADTAGALIVLPCDFGGHETRCVMDSGNATTFIKDDAFSRRFDNEYSGQLTGASGHRVQTAVIYPGSLSAGSIDFGSPQVFRVPVRSGAGSPFIDGTEAYIGIDVLYSKRSLELDFGAAPRLVADQPPSFSSAENRLQRTPSGHLLVSIGLAGETLPALWDTGTSLTAVDIKYIRNRPGVFAPVGAVNTSDGASVVQKTEIYRVKGLVIGGYRFDGDVIGMDLSHLSGILQRRGVSVILGGNFITKLNWYLDLRGKTWSVSRPRPLSQAAAS